MGNEETKNELAEEIKEKKLEKIEVIVAIFLGITAILTAWATWIGSLHGGNQATNYTQSNNIAADGNSRWNEASQSLMQDMMTWNEISSIQIDLAFAKEKGNTEEIDKLNWKLERIIGDNCSESFQEAIEWAVDQGEDTSPFEKEGYVESYFEDANAVIAEADALLEQGKKDNANGDSYNLVTVIYSIVLFLLGIVGIFKGIPNRTLILIISVVLMLVATVYMVTIPLPTDFSFANYF